MLIMWVSQSIVIWFDISAIFLQNRQESSQAQQIPKEIRKMRKVGEKCLQIQKLPRGLWITFAWVYPFFW